MLIASSESLVNALQQYRLLEPAQLQQLPSLQAHFPDPKVLAAELLRRGWLSAFQANQLLQGHGQQLLLGSYVLIERLGEGGMGQVFKARNWKLGKVVALKLIRPEQVANPGAIPRFQREVRAAAALSHANIVHAYDADEVGGTHILVMEYVAGNDLANLVRKHGPLPVALACDYVRQAALGLQHAFEKGLVHRDIKPHNLLVTVDGQTVKVLDMGLARLQPHAEVTESSGSLTVEGTVMGTIDYLAPEQALNAHAADIRSDLYSLGCTLYFLLTARVPFGGDSATEKLLRHQMEEPPPVEGLRPEAAGEVAAVVRRLMARWPAERYQTPAEAAAALAAVSGGGVPSAAAFSEGPTMPPVRSLAPGQETTETGINWSSIVSPPVAQPAALPQPAPPSPWYRRRPWLVGGGSVVLLGGLLLLMFLLKHPGKDRKQLEKESENTQGLPQPEPLATRFTNGLGINLVPIPRGKLTMGSPQLEIERCIALQKGRANVFRSEAPEHQVEITQPFYMGATEVTVGQFRKFVKETKYQVGDGRWQNPGFAQTEDHPVVWVSWQNAVDFCLWLSEKEGRQYRLPTEAEWEYCCRAGRSGERYAFGYADADLEKYAWCKSNSGRASHPVGNLKANAWGLFDMHGNVWEFCQDYYDVSYYKTSPKQDPPGPGIGSARVVRGGSWSDGDRAICRSACRGLASSGSRDSRFGFRVVCTVPRETIANDLGMTFVRIPPGTFWMGSPNTERDRGYLGADESLHLVQLTRPFALGVYPVTRRQFGLFIEDSGYRTDAEKDGKGGRIMVHDPGDPGYWKLEPTCSWRHPPFPQGDDHPVVEVTWNDAKAFCAWLGKKDGRHYTLPSEAEWEYACRAGSRGRYFWGDDEQKLADHVWYEANSGMQTHPVGQKKPNPWGLYDMHGNVQQLCEDYFGPYRGLAARDPLRSDKYENQDLRIYRGGSFYEPPGHQRDASRTGVAPDFRHFVVGFRVCLHLD